MTAGGGVGGSYDRIQKSRHGHASIERLNQGGGDLTCKRHAWLLLFQFVTSCLRHTAQCACAQVYYLSSYLGKSVLLNLRCSSAQQCAVVFKICYDKCLCIFGIRPVNKHVQISNHVRRTTLYHQRCQRNKTLNAPPHVVHSHQRPTVCGMFSPLFVPDAVPGLNLPQQETGALWERIDPTINGHCLVLPPLMQ